MPISADPHDTVPFVFKTDSNKPDPPTAYIRFRTGREEGRIVGLCKAVSVAVDKDDLDALASALTELFTFGIARLENYPEGWTLETLVEHLTGSEWWELERAIVTLPRITEEDRKNSLSPSTSDGAAAATTSTPSTGS